MSLVTPKEVSKVINLDKYGFIGTFFGWLLMKALRISTINKIYNKHKHLEDLEFFSELLDDLQIKFEIPEEDLRRIPKDVAFITVSNHPLGGIDGIVLLKLIAWDDRPESRRDDIKDISDILNHFFDMNDNEIFENHHDLFEKEEASLKHIAARVMGREMSKIAKKNELLRELER